MLMQQVYYSSICTLYAVSISFALLYILHASDGKDDRHRNHFCPDDVGFSVFHQKNQVINIGYNKSMCVDAVIYGYDVLYERSALYSQATWLGVINQQDPTDAIVIQEIIWNVKPDVIIELGTNTGGGAIYYASIMKLAYEDEKPFHVITIDPRDVMKAGDWYKGETRCSRGMINCTTAFSSTIWKRHVKFLHGLPTDPQIVSKVQELLQTFKARSVIVIEDSNHKYDVVLKNIIEYSRFVSVDSYLIVQDTKISRWRVPEAVKSGKIPTENRHRMGPLFAVHDFVRDNVNFSIDKSWEYHFYTQHSNGFLKRIK